jgi:hypothetical protein
MNSALLKDRIDIYELITETTKVGTVRQTYVFKYSARACVQFKGENQVVSEGEVFFPITTNFIVRSHVPVVETDRIYFDNKKWKILSIDKNKYYNDKNILCTLVNE